LSNGVLELKAKLLQVTKENEDLIKEKEDLISQRASYEPLAISQPVDTPKLADYMSSMSLKEKEISQLIQEKNKLVQEKNQLSQEKASWHIIKISLISQTKKHWKR